MRLAKPFLFIAVLAVFCSGCVTHLDYYAYGPTRKLLGSGAPTMTKYVGAPIIFIPDTITAPLASYRDAQTHAPESTGGHVYLSYIGFRTLQGSDLKPIYKWIGGTVVCIVDTLWFPIAGLADAAFAVTN